MIAALVATAIVWVAQAAPPVEAAADTAARIARWQEAIDLDLPPEILRERDWFEAQRAPDSRLVALFARALHAAGDDEAATRLLGPAAAAPLALAAARIALDRDEIALALRHVAPPASGASANTTRFPDEPESWLLEGRARARAGDLTRAEPLLAEFVKRAPWHVDAPAAWFMLVDCARAHGDAAEASRREESRQKSAEWHAFYRARRLQARESPREPLPRLGLAQLWLAADQLDRARSELDAAIALDPRFCRAIEVLGELECRAGRAAEARARCDEALTCDPELTEVHLTVARLARDAGRTEEAAASYARYRERGGTKDL